MKNAQKNYLERRLTEVKTALLQKVDAHYNIKSRLDLEEKLELVLSGKAPLKTSRLKEMLVGAKLGHGAYSYWHDVFDFSEQENAMEASLKPVSKAKAHVEEIFQKAKDTIMLGSESEALKILQELQSLDVKDIVKKFPPVAESKKPAKKKAKR